MVLFKCLKINLFQIQTTMFVTTCEEFLNPT